MGSADEGLAPKTIASAEYRGAANYAYHLDAGKFAPFLARHCAARSSGCAMCLADVVQVNQSANRATSRAVLTPQAGEISGDLFIDCSGFHALLIGKTLGVGFKDCSDVLFCNTALAVQVPFETPDAPMASQTIATAQEAGWIWDICLLDSSRRRPRLLSSRHLRAKKPARETLQRYIGALQHRDLEPRHDVPSGDLPAVRKIPIPAQATARSSGRTIASPSDSPVGFLAEEPLESSAIVLVELSAKLIAEQIPANRELMDIGFEALQ